MAAKSLTSLFANRAAVNHVPANFIRPRIPPVMGATSAKPLLADLLQIKTNEVLENAVDKTVNVAREFYHLTKNESLKNYYDDPRKKTITEKVSNWRDSLRLHFIHQWPTEPSSFRFLPRETMQCLPANFCRKTAWPVYDVFINHRGIDTKWNFAGLLYDNLTRVLRIRTFLDRMSMKPGDRLFDDIDKAILGCKVGVAVFSPRYCESYSCLHELALLMESEKRLVPIFYDIEPSQLEVRDDGTRPAKELQRFHSVLEEARNTVGIKFDSLKGDWSELLRNASDAVLMNLVEVEQGRTRMRRRLRI